VFGFSDGTKFRWEEGYFVLNDEIAENAIKSYEAGRYSDSVKIWMKYAPFGCPASAIGLAMAYWNGNGVSRDFQKSFLWLRRGTLRKKDSQLYLNLAIHYRMGELTKRDNVRAIYCAIVALNLNEDNEEKITEKSNDIINELSNILSEEEFKIYEGLRFYSEKGLSLNSPMVGLFRDMIAEL